jgi:protocatechuate 3,4-dioxygenase beta subunit
MRSVWLVILLSLSAFVVYAQAQVALAPSGHFQISGTLVDSRDGQPVPGARVTVTAGSSRTELAAMITGEDGRFAFTGLAAGHYDLAAQRRGYVRQAFDQHGGFSTAIVTGPDLDPANLVFRLTAECSITGTITDEAGEAVRDAEVSLYQLALGAKNLRESTVPVKITNGDGFYSFSHLRPGQYVVSVSAKVWYAQRPQAKEETTLVAESRGMGWSYRSGTQVAGDYDDSQGQSPLDVAYPPTFYPGVTDPRTLPIINLHAGEKFVANIGLQPVPAVHIRVDATPADAARNSIFVRLQRHVLDGTGSTVSAETRFGKSGGMDIVGIPAGHYSMEMGSRENDGGLSHYLLDAATSGPSAAQDAPGASVSASVQVPPGGRTGSAMHLRLHSYNTGEDLAEAVPEDGEVRFKKRAPPGEYEISLNNNDQGRFLFVKAITAVGAKGTDRAVQIQDGTPVRLKITLGQGAGQLSGRALRKEKPVVGAMIALVPIAPEHNQVLIRRGQTGSDGSFMIAGIVPGKYTIVSLEHGWDLDWWDLGVLKQYLGNGKLLEVEANGKYQTEINLDGQ